MTISNDYTNYLYVPEELQGVRSSNPLEKIATNKELTKASDDPALLAISEQLNYQQSGLTQGVENINSALSYLQIGDSALGEQSDILDTIREKTLQAATDTTSDDQRNIIRNDITKLLEQFDNIASSTSYGDNSILQNSRDDKGESDTFDVQTGTDSQDNTTLNPLQSNTQGLGLDGFLQGGTFSADDARTFLDTIDQASSKLQDFRSDIGSTAQQLESSYTSMSSQVVNNGSALSTISNVDFAKEVSSFSKQNILAQIGSFGQSQANNINQQSVLRLLS
ncbi:flagellin [Arcobacter sp.]|uniref:flagellin n=1 Tax=unclassified Arcobacter TaxID=2593671 RepID=UPI003B00386F|eukprot:TRINITY_DN1237_c0_g2_i8.p1 TRINITY_DN1237_c0_g2~~TRINITY_DN1237_c0_g2_i8.p1  ORF type:complete len:280 (-),score=-4.17 TRINITY_DN1237_c0_g2_i8:1423-2262(-)